MVGIQTWVYCVSEGVVEFFSLFFILLLLLLDVIFVLSDLVFEFGEESVKILNVGANFGDLAWSGGLILEDFNLVVESFDLTLERVHECEGDFEILLEPVLPNFARVA